MFKIFFEEDGKGEEYKAGLCISKIFGKSLLMIDPDRNEGSNLYIYNLLSSIHGADTKIFPMPCSVGVFWYALATEDCKKKDVKTFNIEGDGTILLRTDTIILSKGITEDNQPIWFDIEEINSKKKVAMLFFEFSEKASKIRKIISEIKDDSEARDVDASHDTILKIMEYMKIKGIDEPRREDVEKVAHALLIGKKEIV